MLRYNIYYKNEKINSHPLSKKDLDEIKKREYIGKMDSKTKEISKIPTNMINIVKCYII